jgi:hypothetical protein
MEIAGNLEIFSGQGEEDISYRCDLKLRLPF